MARLVITLLLAFLCGGSQAEIELGSCPTVQPYELLQVSPYLGRWYENSRMNLIFEGAETCVMAIYADNGDGTIQVHNTAINHAHYFTDIYGVAEITSPGILSVTFPGHPAGEYIVLDTDYNSYSAVFSCSETGAYRTQYGWILSRDNPMDPAAYQSALNAFIANGVNTTLLAATPQGPDCYYYKPYFTGRP